MNEPRKKILVIEYEKEVVALLRDTLSGKGFDVEYCHNGHEGLKCLSSFHPDMVVLSMDLPDMDGLALIDKMRMCSQAPIIALSGNRDPLREAQALNQGADDYAYKSVKPEILMARIQANIRKTTQVPRIEPEIINGPIRMDLSRHEVMVGDTKVDFTPKEFEMLRLFLLNKGRVLTRKHILNAVWGSGDMSKVHYLRVYIRQIRDKLKSSPLLKRALVCESGVGYRLELLS